MKEQERILQKQELIFPGANTSLACTTQGSYEPVGAVVHYTAGRRGNPSSTISWANLIDAKQKKTAAYTFHLIEADGTFYQTHPIKRWGFHAGTSEWPGLGKSLSNKLIGIEIAAAGLLSNVKVIDKTAPGYPIGVCEVIGQAWFDQVPRKYFARYNDGRFGPDKGWYEAFTMEQEQKLVDFLIWCKKVLPKFQFDYVLGHHEISPKRKQDPEAALSMSMGELRKFLSQTISS